MKYLKIILAPIKVKGDSEDMETLQADLYEKIATLIEEDKLKFEIDDEDDEDDEGY